MSLLAYVSDVAPYEGPGGRVPAGVHRSLEAAGRAFEELAGMHGLGFSHLKRARELDEAKIESARVLVLFTIGETAWSTSQRQAIERRAASGGLGVMGVHSATDSAYGWPAFGQILGARFAGHPVTARLPVEVVDASHPSTAHLRSPWQFEEELYLFRDLVPEARVLLGVRPGALPDEARRAVAGHGGAGHGGAGGGGAGDGGGGEEVLPLAWCIERGQLRSFYTVLGHFLAAYEDLQYLQHLSGGLQWLLGHHGRDQDG